MTLETVASGSATARQPGRKWPLGRRFPTRTIVAAAIALTFAGCASRRPPPSIPETPPSPEASIRTEVGLASFYGPGFQGKTTASGVPFDRRQPVAAHPRFPFGTRVRVTNLENGRHLVVTVIDRGPTRQYVRQGVIIDLSQGAAEILGFIRQGRQRVRLDVLRWGTGGQGG